jgi:hypothetical protein
MTLTGNKILGSNPARVYIPKVFRNLDIAVLLT